MISFGRMVQPLLGLAALGVAGAASAGTWIDKYGRTLTLQAPGLTEATLASGPRSPAAVAATFKTLCLDTGIDRAAAGKAAEAAGFRYVPATMPFKQPVDVGSWVAADAELTVGRDLFFGKDAQCGLVAMPAGGDSTAAIAAVSALIGGPVNAAKATKKNGSSNKSWQPEWIVPGAAAGLERRVFFHQLQPGRIQIAVIERKGASK